MPRYTNIIREEIQALKAYHVQDSTGMIKLDAMENPFVLPTFLQEQIAQIAAATALNRYPDAAASALKRKLKEIMQLPQGLELLLGNGSDELIQLLALACARPGAVMLGLEPSFVMYRLIAAYTGMRYVGVPLLADFSLDEAATLQAIEQYQPALIFIAYPNNPTGNLFERETLIKIIRAAPGLVVIDEAYQAFAKISFVNDLPTFENLLVMRTLSKMGLAGLRLGLLAGKLQWLDELDKVRLPYNINVLTQKIALKILENKDVLVIQAHTIVEQREILRSRLQTMPSLQIFPSDANFVLIRVPSGPALFEKLKAHGILVKDLSQTHGLLNNCLRITIGTPVENAKLIEVLHTTLS